MRVPNRLSMLVLLGALGGLGACILGPKQDDPSSNGPTGEQPPGDLGADAAPAKDSSGGGAADTFTPTSDTAAAVDAPRSSDTGGADAAPAPGDAGADTGAPDADANADANADADADADADASETADDGGALDASPVEDGG